MNEAELIEISHRFRQLQILIERSDEHICRLKKTLSNGDAREKLDDLRDDIQMWLNSCHHDMERMQEIIRKQASK